MHLLSEKNVKTCRKFYKKFLNHSLWKICKRYSTIALFSLDDINDEACKDILGIKTSIDCLGCISTTEQSLGNYSQM